MRFFGSHFWKSEGGREKEIQLTSPGVLSLLGSELMNKKSNIQGGYLFAIKVFKFAKENAIYLADDTL